MTAGILTAGIVLLPVLRRKIPEEVNVSKALCRTGEKIVRPEEHSRLLRKIIQAGIRNMPFFKKNNIISDNEIADWFTGLKALLAGCGAICFLFLLPFSSKALLFLILAPLLYFLPDMWLNRRIAARQTEIRNSLPRFSRYLATIILSGTDIAVALEKAANATGGAIKEEIEYVMRDYKTSASLIDALLEMSRRTQVDELNSLVQTVRDMYEMGASRAEAMRNYSDRMRMSRRFETMGEAGELSVKLLFPVFIFFLGPFMVIIMYPAVYSLMEAL